MSIGIIYLQGNVKRPSYVIAKFSGILTAICIMIVASVIIAPASQYNITDLGAKESLMIPSSSFNSSDPFDGGYAIADGVSRAIQNEGSF
jgi:hypothetical protein